MRVSSKLRKQPVVHKISRTKADLTRCGLAAYEGNVLSALLAKPRSMRWCLRCEKAVR